MGFKSTMILLLLQHLAISTGDAAFDQYGHLQHSLLQDKAALLKIRNSIEIDPNATLANWNEANYVCNFTGVTCNRHNHRVNRLVLNGTGLVGRLSPYISNLTGLRVLNLVNNHFFGYIPPEFSSLRHLHYLKLDGNNLNGSIADSLAALVNLTVVTINGNRLTGSLPRTFFSNCTLLSNIDLSDNLLTGNIPVEIGDCPNLWNLNLYNNQFTGILPLSLANASLMYNLDVEHNYLSGELPSEIVANWPGLKYLHLSYNNMVSHDNNTNLEPFFTALVNGTADLFELALSGMRLGGRLPDSIGQLGVSFYSLLLDENYIYGSIPTSLANLSRLNVMNLTDNLLNGTIPTEISRLSFLQQLFLSYNSFTVEIPEEFGHFPDLGLLDLSNNKFFGQIPTSLGNLVQLKELLLNNNSLTGKVPSSLGQCTDLYKLDLSHNRLTGIIPPEILNMREMRTYLNISHNFLEGPLPIEISKLEKIEEIDLSSNNLTGSIFSQISSCIALRTINISHNSLQGTLPKSLGDLRNLESVDLSDNDLSGQIPPSLAKIQTLTYLNLSYNYFDGVIPSGGVFDLVTNLSFIGNGGLCGISGMKTCSGNRHWFRTRKFLIITSVAISISAFLLTIGCVMGYRRIKAMMTPTDQAETERTSTQDLIHNIPRITYRELSEATGSFDNNRLIGWGGFGRVYRGVLPDGTVIAVKVLQLQTGNSTKSFNRECQVLKRIRHRNLIRIITACSLPDFKALVLPYMANGSLDNHLYPHSETLLSPGPSDLSLLQRVNICSDIAEGMAYLHHHSPVRVIHCDLKPSNVLLNDDMTALVSDFGIARLVMTIGMGNTGAIENSENSTANMLGGSIGYIAPEYGFGSGISTKGDVYSFGILVLEMVTKKRPTDDMFVGGLSLHKWVKTQSQYHGKVEKVIDSSLLRTTKDQPPEVKKMWEVAIGELIELGILCSQESPSTRPTMIDAADDLDRLKRYLTGDTTTTFASSLGVSSSTLDED